MLKTILILNGPNLNMLGKREPDIYGKETLADIERMCSDKALQHGFKIEFRQSNHEGQLVEWIQSATTIAIADGIVINPAAYSHTSIAILDALKIFKGPVIEVHLSNIHQREDFRHHSYVSYRADAIIAGCGSIGYVLGLDYMASYFHLG